MGKFRVLAKNQFGWSIPSVPSGIVMTPSSGASRAEFYDVLQQIQAREDIEDNSGPLSYECEKKPMKSRSENPGSLDFMSELGKGRFSVTANVNKEGKVYSVKLFDKASTEGGDAAMREFKNLKTLRHEKMVSLVDAFETDRFSLLQFSALPSTDVLSYISERPFYTEQDVCDISGRCWTPWSTSSGAARSTSTSSPPTSSSAPAAPSADQSRSSSPTSRRLRPWPATAPRSRARTTSTTPRPRSSRRPRPIPSLTSGHSVSSSTSSCPANCPSRASPPRRLRTTSSMSSSSSSICTRSAPWRARGCSCGSSRRPPSSVLPWRRLAPTGG